MRAKTTEAQLILILIKLSFLPYTLWQRYYGLKFVTSSSQCLPMGILLCSDFGNGASTVSTPSRDRDDFIRSGFVPSGKRNSLLYSRKTLLESDFSSCFAYTCNIDNRTNKS